MRRMASGGTRKMRRVRSSVVSLPSTYLRNNQRGSEAATVLQTVERGQDGPVAGRQVARRVHHHEEGGDADLDGKVIFSLDDRKTRVFLGEGRSLRYMQGT
jgi:hypothetical protein